MKKLLSALIVLTLTGCSSMVPASFTLDKRKALPENLVAFMSYQKSEHILEALTSWKEYFMQFNTDPETRIQVEMVFGQGMTEMKSVEAVTALVALNDLQPANIEDEANYCFAVGIKHSSATLKDMLNVSPPTVVIDQVGDYHLIRLENCAGESFASAESLMELVESVEAFNQNFAFGLDVKLIKKYVEPLIDTFKAGFFEGFFGEMEREVGSEMAAKLRPEVDKFFEFVQKLRGTKLLMEIDYFFYGFQYDGKMIIDEYTTELASSKHIPLLERVTRGSLEQVELFLTEDVKMRIEQGARGNISTTRLKLENPDASVLLASPLGMFLYGFGWGFFESYSAGSEPVEIDPFDEPVFLDGDDLPIATE